MPNQRHTEVNVLGYRIERVRAFDDRGSVTTQWFEVLAPETDILLGTYERRVEAEREIVARELAALPRQGL